MRSSDGRYFAGLDHVRAVAAFLVVLWHFAHSSNGYPVPFNRSPEIGILDEGHVGVALFMALSGYLFAKLIGERDVLVLPFLWNRLLRLGPLLLLVLLIYGAIHHWRNPSAYLWQLLREPLPNGAWSIVAEFHFYVLLPLMLWGSRLWKWTPLLLVTLAAIFRLYLYGSGADIQHLSYFTIVGRFDQFALGIFFYSVAPTSRMVAGLLLVLVAFYAWFDAIGGFYSADLPILWTFIPALEGAALGAAVAWYDKRAGDGPWFLRKAGEYSYSIYLLHFFFVFAAADLVHTRIMPLTSVYAALPWATVFFVFMMGLGHLSYIYLERPFLQLRRPYKRSHEQMAMS